MGESAVTEYGFTCTAGLLIRNDLRQMLASEVFAGSPIRWMEQKNWLDSKFHIRGPIEAAKAVEHRITYWLKCHGDAE
jgi:hypothetical protein